jgi:uncharacterized protein (DUF362 family)
MESSHNLVSIFRYDGTINPLKNAIEECNGFSELKESDKVLLKPNVVWGGGGTNKIPKFGFITTSRIVEDIIQLLLQHGCRNISIGEGTTEDKELGSDTLKGYKWSGIAKVARKYGVKLIDFNKQPYKEFELGGTKVEISNAALEADFLIDIPVLKTHEMAKVSLGLKNLKGCLSMQSKRKFHQTDLEHMIALLNTQVKPKLTIIDGIYAMERGPTAWGMAHRMNLIIAGRDNLSCDVVGSTILGIEPSSVEHLKEFSSLTNRSLDINLIDIRGESIADISRKMEWETDFEDIFRRVKISGILFQNPGKHYCTGCVVHIQGILSLFCKDNMGMNFDSIEICAGGEVKPKKESKKVFLMGNCSILANKEVKDAFRLKGCPPKAVDMLTTLVKETSDKGRARKILLRRFAKNIAHRLGIYNEDFPTYQHYKAPQFDQRHF